MRILYKILFCFTLLFSAFSLKAQYDTDQLEWVDSATNMILTNVNVAFQVPFNTGYVGEMFAYNYSAGTNVFYKTHKNWTFDVAFNIMFDAKLRSSVKGKDILGDMVNDFDNVIDGSGNVATLSLKGTFWSYGIGIGKIIPVDRWRNSGIWVRLGLGYFGHKIKIGPTDQTVPSLQGDYKKGYDQRGSGFAMNQFLGYLFMRKNRAASFYAGVEFWQMWTQPNRSYSFMLGPKENTPVKFSGSIGIKVGWMIPLYEKKAVTKLYRF